MKLATTLCTILAMAMLSLGPIGCDGDGGDDPSGDSDVSGGETDTIEGDTISDDAATDDSSDEDTQGEVELCAEVDCYDHATCDDATGECVCDEGYEAWTDGEGCAEITQDLCAEVDCFDHATCDPSSGGCACDDGFEAWVEGEGCSQGALSLTGSYDDTWGGHHEVTDTVWTQTGWGSASHFFMTQRSDTEGWAVAQNGPDNEWSPSLWSRFDWTRFDDGSGEELWYCQTAYDAATEDAALAITPADATDPPTSGCGTSSWTKLVEGTPVLQIAGSFTDPYGGTHDVATDLWTQGGWDNPSFFHLTQLSNQAQYAIAENNPHNAWSAGLWSRFDWAWYDGGDGMTLWYCQTAYDAPSEADALAVAAPDATDPTTAGCGGAPWTVLVPSEAHLVIQGSWIDNYGMDHAISATSWIQSIEGAPEYTYTFDLGPFSLVDQWVVAHNATDNPSGSNLWSRFDWTWHDAGDGPELWFCQSAYDAANEDDALATTPADPTDPPTTGCGGTLPWSKLVPAAE